MASVQAFFATVMAVIQLALSVAGICPLGSEPIDYGGDHYPYGAENITAWLALAEDGASDYRIVTPSVSRAAVTEAAVQLQDYFKRISGVELPIAVEDGSAPGKEIHVGRTAAAMAAFGSAITALKPEAFIKKVVGDTVYLVGAHDGGTGYRGTLYAAFSFLEEQLGVRWFTPELTVVPESSLVRIDANLDDTQTPAFEYRDDYWSVVMNDADWKAHHKINSQNGASLGAQYGGGIRYIEFAHSLERLVPDRLFETQPELFSYRVDEGTRTTDQRCLTNHGTYSVTLANVLAALDTHAGAGIFSITQLDNQKYCQCDTCEAEAERLGGQSGLMIWFVNKIAREVAARYHQIVVDTFAYQYTRQPPAFVVEGVDGNVAYDNVCVRLCSIECCFAHPLSECGHERGEDIGDYVSDIPSSFAEDIAGWQDFCQNLYIWDYTTNFGRYLLPFPNFQVLGPNMQFFAENNVKGVFEQGNHTGGKTGEFGEMRAYVLAKLLWDPYADVEYHMMDFMRAYYGTEAAEHIKEYIDLITRKTVETSHLFIFNWHYQNTFLRLWDTRPMDRAWDKAEAAAETPWQLENIRRSRLQLRYYKACMLVDEFGLLHPITRVEQNKKLYQDIVDLGITRLTEWKDITEPEGTAWLMTPIEWVD